MTRFEILTWALMGAKMRFSACEHMVSSYGRKQRTKARNAVKELEALVSAEASRTLDRIGRRAEDDEAWEAIDQDAP